MTETTEARHRWEARRDFVTGIVPLSLWLAHRFWREGMSVREAITTRTDIYRLTCLWDGTNHPSRPPEGWRDERWEEILGQLEALYESYPDGTDTMALEHEGLALLWPLLEARLEQELRPGWNPRARPFGFFTYNQGPEERSLALHLANACAPRSPFADPQARAIELRRLLDHALTSSPPPVRVTCGSWLNSFPPFLQFFPPSWAASASAPSRLGHTYGWWGQMIDRTGGLHRRNAEHLRQTGSFPYACVRCGCSMEELDAHLEARFGIRRGGQPAVRNHSR
jgi:hypothetical protein